MSFTRSAVNLLFERGFSLVILACNTAAAVALRTLQREWLPGHYPDNRILGVLVPTVEAISGVPWLTNVTAGRSAASLRGIEFLSQPDLVARSLGAYLERHPAFDTGG